MINRAGGGNEGFAVVDKVLRLIGAPRPPGLEGLSDLLCLDVYARPDTTLEVYGSHVRIDSHAERLPQLARAIARHLVHCGIAGDVHEDVIAAALLIRCAFAPAPAAPAPRAQLKPLHDCPPAFALVTAAAFV